MNLYTLIQVVTNLFALLCYAGLMRIIWQHGLRGNRLHRLFCLYLSAMIVWETAFLMISISQNAAQALFWYKVTTAVVPAHSIIYFAFVQAFLHTRGAAKAVRFGILLWALTAICSMLNGHAIYPSIHRDVVTGLFVPTFGPLLPLIGVPTYFFPAYAAFHLIRAYRGTKSSLQRSRIQYLLLGIGAVMSGTVANFFPRLQPYPVDVAANIINALLIAYAILRYQFLDIKFVLRKGMLYSIPTAIIGASYFLVVYLVATMLHSTAPLFAAWTGQVLLVSLATAAVTAVAVQPLRDRVQCWVDRLFFREKYDASLMLQRLSHTVASVLELSKLTDMILDAVLTTMHIKRAAILLNDPQSGQFLLVAQKGLPQGANVALSKDHPVIRWLSNHDEILTRRDLELKPQFRALWGQEREHLERMGIELFVPLKAKGRLVGIFAVGEKLSDQTYTTDDQVTLITLANQTAVAIENARLYEAARRELAERIRVEQQLQKLNATLEERVRQRTFDLQVLYELSQKISYVSDLGELFRLLLEGLHRAIPYDASASLLVIDDHRELFIHPVRRMDTVVRQDILQRLVAGFARISGETVDLAGVHTTEIASANNNAPPVARVGSFMEMPLVVGENQAVGFLLVLAEKEKLFSEDHARLLRTVANQISMAIQRLFNLLAAERQRQESLLERLPEGVLLLNDKGRIVLANPVGREYLAMLTEARIGDVLTSLGERPLTELLGPPPEGAICHEVVLKGSPYKVFELVSQRMEAGPQAGGWVLMLRDVTERKQAEEERARLEEQLRQAQKMEAVGLLAGGVAHEFNNLLTIIHGNVELGMMRLEPDHPLQKELSTVLRTAQRAARLTRQLLTFSRRQVLQMEEVDLNELVRGFATMVRPLIGEQIELQMVLTDGLGKISADRNALEQALMNLAVNARDAMPEGGSLRLETAEVTVGEGRHEMCSEAKPGQYVRLTVADTGVGMDEETQRHLFEPFFTTKEVGKGTGLGLAMVYGIVKQHGGWIEVTSQVAKGTKFDIYLPASGEIITERKTELDVESVPRGMETILLAEDEIDVKEFGRNVLEGLGYKVLTAEDGQAAVEMFKANAERIQLVILDVAMPKLSGPKAYEIMRSLRPEVPALFITGYGADMLNLPAEAKVGVHELQKPFTVAKLACTVREVLNEAKMRKDVTSTTVAPTACSYSGL